MNTTYTETDGLCPICAKDSAASYEEKDDGMYIHIECNEHGISSEKVENDKRSFKQGYELEYEKCVKHLALPLTYRCNLNCKYCYTLSNCSWPLPKDRPLSKIAGYIKQFDGNVTLIGGEPTLRKDLMQIISQAKGVMGKNKLSLGTNGLKLSDIEFARKLKENGLDFVFFSFNDIGYERSSKKVHQDKIVALNNCLKLDIPIWIHRTVDGLDQLNVLPDILETYKRIVFEVTLRIVKPFGALYPPNQFFVSDIIKFFGKENDYKKGLSPFNRIIYLKKKKIKICSWVPDTRRVDPVDSNYIISTDLFTTFHRGMRMDEVLIKSRYFQKPDKPSYS